MAPVQKFPRRLQVHLNNDSLSESERQQIQNALESILATDRFIAAPQMSAFLRFVVDQAATGHQSRIKAYTVAIDALGKPDSFDPQNDPVVRVLAGRLRATLDAYNKDNPQAPIIIKMHRGSYVPTFMRPERPLNDTAKEAAIENLVNDNVKFSGSRQSAAFTDTDHATFSPQSLLGKPEKENLHATADLNRASPQFTMSENPISLESPTSQLPEPIGKFSLSVRRFVKQYPKIALMLPIVVLGIFVTGLKDNFGSKIESDTLASSAQTNGSGANPLRSRPAQVSVFINAMDQGSALENNLNTVLSGALLENTDIQVHRKFILEQDTQYWPEDYFLTINAMELPTETRIDLQLIAAQTGQIMHSLPISLDRDSHEKLTQQDLSLIIDSAKNLIEKDGPLFSDYSSKIN